MRKSLILLLTSILILLGLHLLTVKFAGMNGMAFCFIMFFAINPIYFIFLGIISGKRQWYLAVISAVIYLLSMWILFEMAETAFILYASVYLLIGIVTMIITNLITTRVNK